MLNFDFPGHNFDLFEKIHFMEFDFFDFSDKMFLTLHTPFRTPSNAFMRLNDCFVNRKELSMKR